MSDQPETLAAIIAEMRTYADRLDDACAGPSPTDLRAFADRIEAAYKREHAEWHAETEAASATRDQRGDICRERTQFGHQQTQSIQRKSTMSDEASPCVAHETQNTPENFKRFFSAVNCMRHNQRCYFRDRDSISLTLAKRYEREVDAMLHEFSEPPKPIQEELFK